MLLFVFSENPQHRSRIFTVIKIIWAVPLSQNNNTGIVSFGFEKVYIQPKDIALNLALVLLLTPS